MSLQPDRDTTAAVVLRGHVRRQGEDPAAYGIRDHGAINWAPRVPVEGQPLKRVEIAQESILTRRRLDRQERQRRHRRALDTFLGRGAA